MQNDLQRRLCVQTFTVLFGFFSIYIDASAVEDLTNRTPAQLAPMEGVTEKPVPDDGLWVEVEPTNMLPSDITGIYYLVPYRNRRDNWGQTASVGYSSYVPVNYEPNFVAAFYEDVYTSAEMPLIEFQYSLKRNIPLGSMGIEAGVGFYQNQSDTDLIDSEVQLIPVRLGVNLYLDNLWFEPYFVPYAAGGVYTIFYDESIDGSSFGGNTQAAPYMAVGVQMQLNWVDREAARISYTDSGIENTFLYLEGRQFMASQAASDPDFSTSFNWGAGMRLEF
ncbi:MAG: hypothetical protein AB7N80_13955 [Bdellovibrionales bacterium]